MVALEQFADTITVLAVSLKLTPQFNFWVSWCEFKLMADISKLYDFAPLLGSVLNQTVIRPNIQILKALTTSTAHCLKQLNNKEEFV